MPLHMFYVIYALFMLSISQALFIVYFVVTRCNIYDQS